MQHRCRNTDSPHDRNAWQTIYGNAFLSLFGNPIILSLFSVKSDQIILKILIWYPYKHCFIYKKTYHAWNPILKTVKKGQLTPYKTSVQWPGWFLFCFSFYFDFWFFFLLYLDNATSCGHYLIDIFTPDTKRICITTKYIESFDLSEAWRGVSLSYWRGLSVLFTFYLWNFVISARQRIFPDMLSEIEESSSKCI